MELSVIIPTYNRAYNLGDCIEHLSDQQGMDGVQWEVLIVDNNSTDRTKELVQELKNKHKINIRYLFEAEQGVSYARNRGIASTDSRYLVFIDDDILPVPGWLKAIYSTFKERDSDAIAGRIWLKSPRKIPKWIKDDMRGHLGYLDFGNIPLRIDGIAKFFYGGNMAFNRRIFEQVGLFDVQRGPKGEGQKPEESFRGEERVLACQIANASGKIDYAPEAIVYHKVLPHELEKRFYRTMEFNSGYQEVILSDKRFRGQLLGIPLFRFRMLISEMWEYVRQVLVSGPERAFRQQMRIAYVIGSINASYNLNIKNKTKSAM